MLPTQKTYFSNSSNVGEVKVSIPICAARTFSDCEDSWTNLRVLCRTAFPPVGFLFLENKDRQECLSYISSSSPRIGKEDDATFTFTSHRHCDDLCAGPW